MQLAFSLLLLAGVTSFMAGQQPDSPAQTIDQLLTKLQAIQQQEAELAKQKAVVITAIKAEQKRLADLFERLGLNGPVPTPPTPNPPKPPEPADPLKVKLKAAFDSDTSAQKGEQARDLAALYRQAAKLAADESVATSGDLLKRVRDAAKALVGADALKAVRTVAGVELALLVPTDADLTADQRASVASLFAKLAAALEELAK